MKKHPTSGVHPRRAGVAAIAATIILLAFTACSAAEPPVPTPDRMNQSELNSLAKKAVERSRASLEASYPGVQLPDVQLVRYVSEKEQPEVQRSCMDEEGFASTIDKYGQISYSGVTPEQTEPFDIAQYVCGVRYPIDPKYQIPFNDKELSYLYDYYTGTLTKCLKGQGYQVAEPPSRGTFIDNYYSSTAGWTPYQNVDAPTPAAWKSVNEKCPQTPIALTRK